MFGKRLRSLRECRVPIGDTTNTCIIIDDIVSHLCKEELALLYIRCQLQVCTFPSIFSKAISSLNNLNLLVLASAPMRIARPNLSTVFLHHGRRQNLSVTWQSLLVLLNFIHVSFTILNSAFHLCARSAGMNTPSLLHLFGKTLRRTPSMKLEQPLYPIHACSGSSTESRSSFKQTF